MNKIVPQKNQDSSEEKPKSTGGSSFILSKEELESNNMYLLSNKLGSVLYKNNPKQYELDFFGARSDATPYPNDLCRAGLFSIEQTVSRESLKNM